MGVTLCHGIQGWSVLGEVYGGDVMPWYTGMGCGVMAWETHIQCGASTYV